MTNCKEVKKFLSFFGLDYEAGDLSTQIIKIKEILSFIEGKDWVVMPDKNIKFSKESLEIFLHYSVSTSAAAKLLFGNNKYLSEINEFPIETVKYATICLTDETEEFNMELDGYSSDVLFNLSILKYFPTEWIVKNFIICEDKTVVRYDNKTKNFYLDKFDGKDVLNKTCLAVNLSTIETALYTNKVEDIYKLYLNN